MIPAAQTNRRQTTLLRLHRGLSVVELMCATAITGVLLGEALPAMRSLHQRQALAAQAAALETDVQFARSQARASNRPVRLTLLATADGGSCYMVHTGPASACHCEAGAPARCEAGAQLLQVTEQPASSGVTLGRAGRSIVFDAGKGTVTPTATFVLANRDGQMVHQIVNIVGRSRSCTPNGTPGYVTCR